ncbi:hypothetical protein ACI2L1_10335 [Streptomyces sp. NPDC019531]
MAADLATGRAEPNPASGWTAWPGPENRPEGRIRRLAVTAFEDGPRH